MKKAFTLVELLVVVMVIGILMGLVVRFGNISVDAQKRNITVSRLQRLENAISGYYAVFGTYPPVALQGSRNIYLEVSAHGIQNVDGNENTSLWGWIDGNGKVSNPTAEERAWRQVKAACEAQPVACYYPYSEDYREFVESYSDDLKAFVESVGGDVSEDRKSVLAAGFDSGTPIGRFSNYKGEVEWTKIQLFKFGLMSYLLPRYLFMMEGPEELLKYAQWTGNNELPSDPFYGGTYNGGWEGLRRDANSTSAGDLVRVANIPSQAVTARWMANFEHSLTVGRSRTFFGVDVKAEDDDTTVNENDLNLNIEIYSPGGYDQDSNSGQYVLNATTIRDGWKNEFYYYSPAPYQSYVVWSGGPNGRTFPPWINRTKLSSQANDCVGYWIKDDIGSLKK